VKVLQLLVTLIAFVDVSAAVAQTESEQVYAVAYLNQHGAQLQGKSVVVLGYLRAGFDGHDPLCLLSSSRRKDGPMDLVWVESRTCAELTDKREYRSEYATVTGVVSYSEDGFFVAPVVVHTILREALIKWGK
jgi:hypothetical protein